MEQLKCFPMRAGNILNLRDCILATIPRTTCMPRPGTRFCGKHQYYKWNHTTAERGLGAKSYNNKFSYWSNVKILYSKSLIHVLLYLLSFIFLSNTTVCPSMSGGVGLEIIHKCEWLCIFMVNITDYQCFLAFVNAAYISAFARDATGCRMCFWRSHFFS